VDFIDDDGNVSLIRIDVFPYGGGQSNIREEFSGVTSGTIEFEVFVGYLYPGYYTFDLYVMDTKNLESNTLSEEFQAY
jgi:hypothetical protein